VAQRHRVLWAGQGRSAATRARAETAGLVEVDTVAVVAQRCDVVLSICPPHAATQVAAGVAGTDCPFVDCNAIAPATVRDIERRVAGAGRRGFVDAAIIGPPPQASGTTRLYVSGDHATEVAALFAGSNVDVRILEGGVGTASGLKMAYAAWTKGSAALLLTARALASYEGVDQALLAEWRLLPGMVERMESASQAALGKGWRWVAEMQEIATAMTAADLPDGFHWAAAERRGQRV
jgi:3-hydroxyisobutyrate dehydrogenase-like beta-hydroxyacid dehydrogenase